MKIGRAIIDSRGTGSAGTTGASLAARPSRRSASLIIPLVSLLLLLLLLLSLLLLLLLLLLHLLLHSSLLLTHARSPRLIWTAGTLPRGG